MQGKRETKCINREGADNFMEMTCDARIYRDWNGQIKHKIVISVNNLGNIYRSSSIIEYQTQEVVNRDTF